MSLINDLNNLKQRLTYELLSEYSNGDYDGVSEINKVLAELEKLMKTLNKYV